jgi:hypothetical protein
MALPVRKGYKGAPAQAVLTNSPTNSDTSFVVDTVTGWATTFPFYCVVDPGTSKEEKVKITAISGTTLTVVRNQDDTNASGHNAGAAIYPVFTADEADEANLIASVMTTKGDVIATDGSTINRLGIGTNTHVLQADSTATNGFKWGQIVEAGIADSAVTSAKIANGAIVDADVNASAAIAYSKLALSNSVVAGDLTTGAVTSAKILDATIVAGDLADAAVTSPKLAAPTLTSKTDSFTLALVDANCTMQCNKGTPMTLTVPSASGGSPVDFADGTVITVVNYGAGQVTIAGATGTGAVTVRSANGLKLRVQYSVASLVKISDTEWVLTGDTVA